MFEKILKKRNFQNPSPSPSLILAQRDPSYFFFFLPGPPNLLGPQSPKQAAGLPSLSLVRACGPALSPRGPRSSPCPSSSQRPAPPFFSLSPTDRSGPHVGTIPFLRSAPPLLCFQTASAAAGHCPASSAPPPSILPFKSI
jgi:hypothetical protein